MKIKSSRQQKGRAGGRRSKRSEVTHRRNLAAMRRANRSAKGLELPDEQWLQEVRSIIRTISRLLDELEIFFRAMEVLGSKQAVRRWFNGVVPTLAARPIDLCETARGRRAVLRELGRIEHGVHS
jgi:hypothetical protein